MITRFLLLTTAPVESFAQTLAFTGSASRTGVPGGTRTTRVGAQASVVNASMKASGQRVVLGSVLTGLILLVDQFVQGCLHQALTDAE
jgi:hypothetical protein